MLVGGQPISMLQMYPAECRVWHHPFMLRRRLSNRWGIVRGSPFQLTPIALSLCCAASFAQATRPGYSAAMNDTGRHFLHATQVLDSPSAFAGGSVSNGVFDLTRGVTLRPSAANPAEFESQAIETPRPFEELLLSWNIDCPPRSGFEVDVRVRRASHDAWSSWLRVGDWGSIQLDGSTATAFEHGCVKVDYLVCDVPHRQFQYRIRAATAEPQPASIRIVRFAYCVTSRCEPGNTPRSHPIAQPEPRKGRTPLRTLAVPYRSQKSEHETISGRICSPTSLAMVLDYYGLRIPTSQVAERCFDPTHDIYGNWPRNVQAAFSLGCGGYLTRVADWDDVEAFIRDGRPLIASIRVRTPGGLRGAPYQTTDGHLLVIRGFDANGDLLVNDPAARDADAGMCAYSRAEMDAAWLRGAGGVTYVLLGADGRR